MLHNGTTPNSVTLEKLHIVVYIRLSVLMLLCSVYLLHCSLSRSALTPPSSSIRRQHPTKGDEKSSRTRKKEKRRGIRRGLGEDRGGKGEEQ